MGLYGVCMGFVWCLLIRDFYFSSSMPRDHSFCSEPSKKYFFLAELIILIRSHRRRGCPALHSTEAHSGRRTSFCRYRVS